MGHRNRPLRLSLSLSWWAGHSAHIVLLVFCSHLCILCKISIGDDVDVDNDEDADDDVNDVDDDDVCIRVAVKFNASQLFCLNELQ